MNPLSDISTARLSEELRKREGVESVQVAPYEPLTITLNEKGHPVTVRVTGPATILINQD